MRRLLVVLRLAVVLMGLLATYELTNTNYIVHACLHGMYCSAYEGTRNGFGCGSSCSAAQTAAVMDMQSKGFAACAGSDGTCQVHQWYVSIECYFDEGSGQYCEEVQQDYGCGYCV